MYVGRSTSCNGTTPSLLLLVLLLQLVCVLKTFSIDNNSIQVFDEFIKKYNKSYSTSTDEYEYRCRIFQESLKRIKKLNQFRANETFALYGITQYADLTPEEFRSKVLKRFPVQMNAGNDKPSVPLQPSRRKRSANTIIKTASLPSKFDWRDRNVVTAVKNQGDCGACWALSNIETIETMYAIKTGKLRELSVQQVVDCALNGNYGCQGGDTCSALMWMNSTKVHIVTEKEYPFVRVTQQCKMENPPHGVQVQSFTCIDYRNNENEMISLIVSHGPLVVAVDATMWQDYLGGIIKYHCETIHNHAVQIVGYDLTGPVPYYIVRNSWGSHFGLNGYLHIAIGKNLCGIAREVATVDVI